MVKSRSIILGFMVTVQVANALRLQQSNNVANAPLPQSEDVENSEMRFVKELENGDKPGVFTSCSAEQDTSGNVLNCFRRAVDSQSLPLRVLDHLTYSEDFKLLKSEPNFVIGEDPRVLNSSHVFDNFKSDMMLIDTKTKKRYPVHHNGQPADGKNYVWYVHKSQLYAIKWFKPLEIIACAKKDNVLGCDDYFKEHSTEPDQTMRGGTVGYSHGGGVAGFAHYNDNYKSHRVFHWKLKDLDSGKPTLEVKTVKMPGSLNICDPTSVVVIKGTPYLLTTESLEVWDKLNQVYVNKVYEIKGHKFDFI